MSQAKGMMFLDTGHPILAETLKKRFSAKKHEPVDISFADFDGVRYRVFSDPSSPSQLKVSIRMAAYESLKGNGLEEVLSGAYGGLVESSPDEDFDLTLKIDLDNLNGKPEDLVKSVSELKRNLMGGLFTRYFDALCDGKAESLGSLTVDYRSTESMYIIPGDDRVVVVYSVDFSDATDRAVAGVFLQEFAEAQRHVSNAPPVAFSRDAPREIRGIKNVRDDGSMVGFVSFAVFKHHVDGTRGDRNNVITLLQSFRAYLDYHIKASKSYLHTRMRRRVNELLKVLNRAHPLSEEKKEKKTMKGRTFTRK